MDWRTKIHKDMDRWSEQKENSPLFKDVIRELHLKIAELELELKNKDEIIKVLINK